MLNPFANISHNTFNWQKVFKYPALVLGTEIVFQ